MMVSMSASMWGMLLGEKLVLLLVVMSAMTLDEKMVLQWAPMLDGRMDNV